MRTVFTKGDLETLKKANNIQTTAGEFEGSTDDLLSTISKLIPGEAVAVFLAILGLVEGRLETTPAWLIGLVAFIIGLAFAVGIAWYKASSERVKFCGRKELYEIPRAWIKTILTVVAYGIWAFNIEGFIAIIQGVAPVYDPVFAAIALIVWTPGIPWLYFALFKP